ANYILYRNRGNQHLFNEVKDEDGKQDFSERFTYLLPSDMNIYTVQADYLHPLPKKLRIDGGFKAAHVMNDNEFRIADQVPGSGSNVSDRSNRFIYRETISAVYISSRKEWKRISMQAGLRVENTQMDGNQLGNSTVGGSRFKKNYTNAFPSFFASYKLDTSNVNFLDLSFARRVRRPNYQYLNPFVYFVDQYSLSAGNPDLNPQFAYQLEFKYRYKRYFGIGLQYNYHNDVIFQVTEAVDKVFVTRPRNVAKGVITSLITNATIPVATWWNININLNLAHLHLQGEAYDQAIDQETFSIRSNMNQQFTLGNGFSAEIVAVYNGRDINGQRYIDPRFRLNAGVLKKMLKGKATIRLSVDDIFYGWRQQEESRSLQNALAYNLYVSDTRRGAIGFTWAFGKESSKRKRTLNENSAQEEKGRVD
ncbi:MAG: TonB-dependent receptor, partial [Sphingobacteriales bacterium]